MAFQICLCTFKRMYARLIKLGKFKKMKKTIAIIGTVGVPANYGGFETLAEWLVDYHANNLKNDSNLVVYCSSKSYDAQLDYYKSAKLHYIPLSANGSSSVMYDMISIIHAALKGYDSLLILGVSGALILPFIRLFTKIKIVTNVDGIEWKRDKWNFFAKSFLRLSEFIATKTSHVVISDNQAIADHVKSNYNVLSEVIAYGGDHALVPSQKELIHLNLPNEYSLSLCRIEPENNVDMILSAFSQLNEKALVFVGNWNSSEYGKKLKDKYSVFSNIYIVDPIYDLAELYQIRKKCSLYCHGHSAGGTNPSLVEMMHFEKTIFCFDCNFNRYSTEDKTMYFKNSDEIIEILKNPYQNLSDVAKSMIAIANKEYRWGIIGKRYFSLVD